MNSSGVDDSPSKALGSILTTAIFNKGKRLCVSQSPVTVTKRLTQAMLKGSKADLSLPEAQSMVGWFCCFGPGPKQCADSVLRQEQGSSVLLWAAKEPKRRKERAPVSCPLQGQSPLGLLHPTWLFSSNPANRKYPPKTTPTLQGQGGSQVRILAVEAENPSSNPNTQVESQA